MKVLFPYVGDSVGGSHISSYELIKGLREQGITPIILLHQKGVHSEWLDKKGEKYVLKPYKFYEWELKRYRNIFHILRNCFVARRFLSDNNITIVHCNDSRMNLTWSIYAKFAGAKMVWHQRTKWFNKPGKLTVFLLKLATGCITTSNFISEVPPKINPSHKLIYNPINQDRINKIKARKKLENEFNLDFDKIIISTFGNAQKQKRPDVFMKTAKYLLAKHPDKFCFMWFGNDYDNSFNNAYKTEFNKINKNVLHVPFRSDIKSLIAGSDIILVTAENDAFGRTLPEAMSVGTPVIASKSGGHIEIIDDEINGLLFESGDPVDCANKIEKLVKDDVLFKKVQKGGYDKVKEYSPSKHVTEVIKFYKELN